MQYFRVRTCSVEGMECYPGELETCLLNGFPSVEMSGLADSAVRELRSRVRAAIRVSGFDFPKSRIIVGLSPAWLSKNGTSYDLALSLAILSASGQIPLSTHTNEVYVFGELGLDGRVRGVPALYPMLLGVLASGAQKVIIPEENMRECRGLNKLRIAAVRNLNEAVDYYSGRSVFPSEQEPPEEIESQVEEVIESGLVGQESARRAVLISASGQHPLLLMGAPGSGKTTLLRSIKSLLPPLTKSETEELSSIYSLAQVWDERVLQKGQRPFIEPHHSISPCALLGGGVPPRVGQAGLAHRGVLFLDELPDFRTLVLERLRHTMSEEVIRLERGAYHHCYPASFLLVAAANPCRCGLALEKGGCRCLQADLQRYLSHLSGALLDRFQLMVCMRRLKSEEYSESVNRNLAVARELTQKIKGEIAEAWFRQEMRCREQAVPFTFNGKVPIDSIQEKWSIASSVMAYASDLAVNLNLSPRSYQNLLRTARTIADLVGRSEVLREDLAEALSYRVSLEQIL